MNRTIHIIKIWLPTVLWICCIFYLSTEVFSADHTSRILKRLLSFLLPDISMREIFIIHFFVRKAAHIVEFCIMSLLLFHSFRNTQKQQRYWSWVLYSLIIIVIVAATDELHQWFITSRTSSVIDIVIDVTGGILGQAICVIFYRLRTRENKSDID